MAALLYLSGFPFGVWGLDVGLIISVPEFSYFLFTVTIFIPVLLNVNTKHIKPK